MSAPPSPQPVEVCAALVTYGDRFALLERTLAAVLGQGVGSVVVVDNGSRAASRDALREAALREPRLGVVRSARNGGSAEGFAHAIDAALATPARFVWLLDDDNVPQPGALQALLAEWARSVGPDDAHRIALASLRADRPSYVDALAQAHGELVLPPRDAFAGFHVALLARLLRERARRAPATSLAGAPETTTLPACAWGGFFAHRALVEALPPPDASHVLYMDDFACTRTIVARGGAILLVRDSVVRDAERSSHLPERKRWLHHSLFEARSDAAAYYALRNGVHFAREHLTDRVWLYRVNAVAFVALIVAIGSLRGRWHRLAVAGRALRDGVAGRLGRSEAYPL